MRGGLSKGINRYDSIYHENEARTRYHGFVLNNEGTDNPWPGEWWGEVSPPWGSGGCVSESMLADWLREEYPNQSWAIQEVVWIAEPTRWRESSGSTTYLGSNWGRP